MISITMPMFKHEILRRHNGPNGVVLTPVATAKLMNTPEPNSRFISDCNDLARKELENANSVVDAYLYKVDGETEYFISKYFYKWPNKE